MKTTFTKPFVKDYNRLPAQIQKLFDKQLSLLLTNFHHPSLRTKKIQGTDRIWEGSVTMNYRFTFEIIDDTLCFRRIGMHNILNHP
ncbi:MAG: hypothetical protein WC955_07210 [Elusimicrobiota bacterium]